MFDGKTHGVMFEQNFGQFRSDSITPIKHGRPFKNNLWIWKTIAIYASPLRNGVFPICFSSIFFCSKPP